MSLPIRKKSGNLFNEPRILATTPRVFRSLIFFEKAHILHEIFLCGHIHNNLNFVAAMTTFQPVDSSVYFEFILSFLIYHFFTSLVNKFHLQLKNYK